MKVVSLVQPYRDEILLRGEVTSRVRVRVSPQSGATYFSIFLSFLNRRVPGLCARAIRS